MWSALRTLLSFLFSKATAIVLVGLLVVGAVALWLFATHHLEARRAEVEAQRLRAEKATARLVETTARAEELARDRRRLEAIRDQAGRLFVEQRERLAAEVEQQSRFAGEVAGDIREVDRTTIRVAAALEKLLAPFAETEWIPDWVQQPAARWRAQLDELANRRHQLERRQQRAELAATQARESIAELVERNSQRGRELQQQLEATTGNEAAQRAELGRRQALAGEEENRLQRLRERLAEEEKLVAGATFWLRRSWDTVKWYLLGIILVWLFGPLVIRSLAYFLWAPLIDRAPPVRLDDHRAIGLVAGTSAPARKLWLEPGEVAIVHERFLQSSDEPLRRRTQWLWRWRYPFTSLATGMCLMTRLANEEHDDRNPDSGAGAERPDDQLAAAQLTLSSQDDETIELAVIELPAGARLACRPRFLAGLVHALGEPPEICSRWVFGRLHSWVTWQFRHFVFHGPVKLVLAAGRGVQVEEVEGRSRRTNQDLTIAFEPWLRYRSRRCETFLAYLRGQNPLFDDLFQGEGTYLAQQVRRRGVDGEGRRSFWQDFFGLLFKALGL